MVNSIKILEELKELLCSGDNKDKNCISLHTLKELLDIRRSDYAKFIEWHEKYLDNLIKENYNSTAELIIHEFDYKRNHLILSFKVNDDSMQRLIYTKKDNDLILLNKESQLSNEISNLIGYELINLYDRFMNFNNFMTQNSYFKKVINTNFEFSVIDPYLTINYRNSDNMLDDFDLSYNYKKNQYESDTKYEDVSKLIKLNEDKIFKNLFVNINDCPKWSRNILYNVRKGELKQSKQKVLN